MPKLVEGVRAFAPLIWARFPPVIGDLRRPSALFENPSPRNLCEASLLFELRAIKMLAWPTLLRTVLVALAAFGGRRGVGMLAGVQEAAEADVAPSKLRGSKVVLRESAKRFKACLSRDDVNIEGFLAAGDDFVKGLQRFGEFTKAGVTDARQNMRKVEMAREGRIKSMRALLMDQVRRGLRNDGGGPASGSGAEALLWARLGIKMWVEIFKDRLCSPRKASLGEAMRSGFDRTLARYLDRFGRAAFKVATRAAPDWDTVRERTHLGCDVNGVCSDEGLESELRLFVQQVEPVLERMTQLHKEAGLEDPRTP